MRSSCFSLTNAQDCRPAPPGRTKNKPLTSTHLPDPLTPDLLDPLTPTPLPLKFPSVLEKLSLGQEPALGQISGCPPGRKTESPTHPDPSHTLQKASPSKRVFCLLHHPKFLLCPVLGFPYQSREARPGRVPQHQHMLNRCLIKDGADHTKCL